ncbi:allophanate hydrolase [Komagataeibacter xylinus]|uniref:Biotin-dependent carboxyltransferase n=2 Tax=Komagataeibacter TaxID=1434011 RepID=A0A850P8Y3_9PROT|nr:MULTISPECIES: biotin-dependent carboxyltransferase family protein [Komagataeibacter]AZV40519.1 allophanate hydrolase [Komagataeibacter xylinus]NVN38342.1 biotin-dependent carboxyltransferase [Komagataeibacter swingsii]PYD55645.1 allophanate hydrolase [Komagataeibacter xylinus]GBQ68569.1 allophanate hydrolase subunit 2 [Komagataeibacter xylinus NBRC 15237]
MIEILTGSALNTVQDLGRPRAMTMGVARGGAMDACALMVGNALLGNDAHDAGIEIAFFPFRVRFHKRVNLALTGACGPVRLDERMLPANWAITAQPGQVLAIAPPLRGARMYLAIEGGIDVPVVLGARSTDLKGGFGGFHGRALNKGDMLPCHPASMMIPEGGYGLAVPLSLPCAEETVVRILPAAEYEMFVPQARAALQSGIWSLTPSINRTGYRLDGPSLDLAVPLGLFSHGIVPGTIQVPPSGKPIIQMADANTCGGYPKIATVVEPDLRLLAQSSVGSIVRFVEVTREEVVTEMRAQALRSEQLIVELASLRRTLIPWRSQSCPA